MASRVACNVRSWYLSPRKSCIRINQYSYYSHLGKTSCLHITLPPHRLNGVAHRSSATTGVAVSDAEKKCGKRDPLDTQFNDAVASFKSKSTGEVLRSYIVYKLISVNFLVENNVKLMKLGKKILGNYLFGMLMKASFYGQFVAGEDDVKIRPTLKDLQSFGVKAILDYSVEEDISHEEAEKLEMESSQSEAERQGQPSEGVEIGGEMPQYQVHKSFADRRYKVSSARTYFYLNESNCEKNLAIFQKSLETAARYTGNTGITAIKLTALGRPQMLLQLSEVIMRARNFVSTVMGGRGNVLGQHFTPEMLEQKLKENGIKDTAKFFEKVVTDREGVIHLFPWSGILNENFELSDTFRVPSLKEGRMVRLISQLSGTEEAMFRNMVQRLNTLVNTAKALDVRLMVDAEQSYFQPAISRITIEMMNKYNTEKAIVFNTYQCYLKEAFNEVTTDLEQAKRQKFFFGAKLVRGAYIDQERERAAEFKYPDPINPTYEATSEMYHKTLTECLRRIKTFQEAGEPKRVAIMVASHNEDTVRFAIEQMKNLGITPEDKVICFGQLLGMCDYITFPLGQAGYSAYKYIPYGPVNEVLPYLSRRATENKGVLTKLKKEKTMRSKEILRRISKGQIFYKPPAGEYLPC